MKAASTSFRNKYMLVNGKHLNQIFQICQFYSEIKKHWHHNIQFLAQAVASLSPLPSTFEI